MRLWQMKNNRYQSEDQALHLSLRPDTTVVPAAVRNTSNRAVVATIRRDIL